MGAPMQLTLNVSTRDEASFINFIVGSNTVALQALLKAIEQQDSGLLYLWGKQQSGRSHLLEAASHLATRLGWRCAYFPLQELKQYSPAILDDLTPLDLVAIDDVDAIAGESVWEEALFAAYNQLQDAKRLLIVTSSAPPQHCHFKLPDLVSRFRSGLIFHIHPLTDQQRRTALQLRAQRRGLLLSLEAANFILHRGPRQMHNLFSLLDQLDTASLSAQRRLTIPFIKQTLRW